MTGRERIRIGVVAVTAFALGALVGGKYVLQNPDYGLGRVINTALGKPADTDYSQYWDVYGRLEQQFVGEIDRQQLLYGAIRGTVDALGDRFSLFLDPEEADRFFADINGEFSGIGAELSQEGESFVVIAPLADSPAAAAGLKAQDVILTVDGVDAATYEFGELINHIRGPKGTPVTLEVGRAGADDPIELVVTRDTIQLESVRYEQRDDGLALVHIIQFSDDTLEEVAGLVDDLTSAGAKGIILDLRNDPGGFLDTAIDVGSLFVKEGPIVIEENKAGERKEFDTTLDPRLSDYPLVVLVNGGSASAAEIVAGAIQDRDEGTLVGTVTFGKGSVQEVERLEDGSALRLTVAKWLTPDGRAINGTGITPDVELEDNAETEDDEQLQRAVEILTKQ